jgi:hypothetical protein
LLLARRLYPGGYSPKVEAFVKSFSGLHKLVFSKYWIDELYGALIVTPVRWLSRFLADAVDFFFIDFIGVNGSAKVVDWTGQVARWIQSGNIQRYVVALLAGAAVLIFFFIKYSDADFTIKPDDQVKVGEQVEFEARLKGTDARKVEYQWDFDGDGNWDTKWQTSPVASHSFDKKHKKKKVRVVLRIRDLRWKRVETGSRKVEVQ